MKRFWGFVVKEMFHILRDYRTLLILFGMPAVQLLLFGYVLTNEIKDAKIAVYDPSRDAVTTKLTNKILSSGYFILDHNLRSVAETEEVFRKGNVKLAIIYEEGFAQKLEKNGSARLQIIADASDPNTASILVNYAQGIVSSYLAATNAATVPLRIIPEVRMAYNASLKGVFMFVPGLMAMLLMLISALMTSLSITREKELGTMELLLVSPLRPAQIIIGKVFPYVFLAFIDACIILLLGNLVFGVPIRGSAGLLLMESLLFISMALSLGILISAITSSQQVAMMISLVALMLPTILLSGFVFPIENMPAIMQILCHIMPPTYYIKIVKSIMLQGNGIEFIWRETLILAGFTLFFLILSIRKFNIRLA